MQLLAFILYFVLILAIGLFFFFRAKNGGEKEYFLGGRSMGPWVTAMSAQASDMSGWLLMGFPGSILALGMGQVWIGIGLALGTIANWLIVAKRLRRFSQASNDSITLPQYLTNRFATKSPLLKIVCAVIFLISFTVYVASAFRAGTEVMCNVIPWFNEFENRKLLARALFALLILIYTFLGGYKAVCWTDFFQGLLMLIALLAVPIVMCMGESNPALTTAFTDGVYAFESNPFTVKWQEIASGLAWGLGYFGMPHIIVRFMGIQKPSQVKKASTVAIIWVVLTLSCAIAIAIMGRTFLFNDGSSLAETLLPNEKEKIFITLAVEIFPPVIAGLLLAAIVAAAMSTADSQLLVASSSFTSDLYNPLIRKNKASEKESLWVGRIVVILVSLVAFWIASSGAEWSESIMNMVESAWGLFGAAFGPVVILSLFWRRMNYAGACAGIITGALVDIGWLLCFTDTIIKNGGLIATTDVYEILPGFIAGALATILVSLATKAPSAEVDAIYANATNPDLED